MVIPRLQAIALFLGPALFAASPLFWINGHYGINGGMLIALSMVPWVYGLIGEYEHLRTRVPVLAGLWLLLVLIGMFGSIAFGLQGFFEGIFGFHDRVALQRFTDYPPQSLLVLWLPGPTFPLSMIVLGLLLLHTRLEPWWVAVLICLAGIAFPVARVLRLEWVAYLVDVLVLVSFAQLAWHAWYRARGDTASVEGGSP